MSLLSFICDLNIKGININEDTIKSFFRRNNGEGSYTCFYTFFEEFIEEAIMDKTLEKNTIKAYKSTLNVLKLFKQNVTFKDIDISFIKKLMAIYFLTQATDLTIRASAQQQHTSSGTTVSGQIIEVRISCTD